MNWYKLYKQASPPLPVDISEEDRQFVPAVSGASRIDRLMSQETADKERLRLNSPVYLGTGTSGLVVDTQDGYVTKYVSDESDAEMASSLIGVNKYPIAKVRSVQLVQEDPKIWAISLEKVKPYNELDPNHIMWSKIYLDLFAKLGRIGLSWDLGYNNVGWNKENKPVLFDLGAWM